MASGNLRFWTFLTGMLLCAAVMVLVIDLGIKSAILEESNKLKRLIWDVTDGGSIEEIREEFVNGRKPEEPDHERTASDAAVNGFVFDDVLDKRTAGLETGHVPAENNGVAARPAQKSRPKPGSSAGNPEVS